MTYLHHLAIVASICVSLAVLGVRQGSTLLVTWYPIAAWSSLIYLAVTAVRLRAKGRLGASITSAANVVQAFGICAMILGVAAGLYAAVGGGRVESIADLPVGKVLAPFVEGLVSMGLGILLSVAIQFTEDETDRGVAYATTDRIADRLGMGTNPSFEDFEKLRLTIQEANGAAEHLKKNLVEAGGRAGDAARQFAEVLMNVARLVEDLNRFFPAEGPPRADAPRANGGG